MSVFIDNWVLLSLVQESFVCARRWYSCYFIKATVEYSLKPGFREVTATTKNEQDKEKLNPPKLQLL